MEGWAICPPPLLPERQQLLCFLSFLTGLGVSGQCNMVTEVRDTFINHLSSNQRQETGAPEVKEVVEL